MLVRLRFTSETLSSTWGRYALVSLCVIPMLIFCQDLIVPAMYTPSVEVLHSLLLLAWAEYGSGRENGLHLYNSVRTLRVTPLLNQSLIMIYSWLYKWRPSLALEMRMPCKQSLWKLIEVTCAKPGGMWSFWTSFRRGVSRHTGSNNDDQRADQEHLQPLAILQV